MIRWQSDMGEEFDRDRRLKERCRTLARDLPRFVTLFEGEAPVLQMMLDTQDVRWRFILHSLTLTGADDYALENLRGYLLTELTLDGGTFGDKSVPLLAAQTALKNLSLPGRVKLSPEGLLALRAALPNCVITGAEVCEGKPPPPAPPPPAPPPKKAWWKFW